MGRAQGDPALRRGRRRRAGAGCGRCASRGDRRRRRRPHRDARIQRLDPRSPEERAGLGLEAARSNPLRNKPAAVIGASTGAFGAVWAQAELRKVLGTIGARVLEGVAVGHAPTRFDEQGRLTDEQLLEQLREVFSGLVDEPSAVPSTLRATA